VDPPGWTVEARDFMLKKPYQVDADGYISLSDAPGMGLELDELAIQKHTKQHWISDKVN
jgi:L-alanine-DL-glutamate epimerase-like enolase superfamily enzyme